MPKPTLKYRPLSIVRMLWKQKILIVTAGTVLSGAGAVMVSRLPDVYHAESLILVDSQKIPERFVASTVQASMEEHLAKVSQQILSTTQLEKLIEKFNLYPKLRQTKTPEQVIDQMRADVQIIPEKGWGNGRPDASTGAFRVVYEGPNPTVVASVVNEISELFITGNLRAREIRAEGTSEFLESQLEEARKSLETQEANLSRFKMERMGELPEQEAALIGTLSRLHSELQGNQDAINRAEQNKLMLENTLRLAETAEAAVLRAVEQTSPPPSANGAPSTTAAGVPPTLRSQTLQEQLDALRLRYHDEHPEIKRLKSEVASALKQEEQEAEASKTSAAVGKRTVIAEAGTVPSLSLQLRAELGRERERVATTRTQLAFTSKEVEARVADRQRILKSIAEYQAKVERLPMREQELAAVTRDYEISKQNYKSLLDNKMSAEMATDMERRQQAAQFTVQDPARVPSKPIKPKRLILNCVVGFLALVISLAGAFGLELRKNYFLGEWELPSAVPVLGRVPTIVINTPARAVSGD
jgi:polysaccharide chain length determinant protein (PEP-CTERM system associated)